MQISLHDEYLLVFIVEQNLVGISAAVLAVLHRHRAIMQKHDEQESLANAKVNARQHCVVRFH